MGFKRYIIYWVLYVIICVCFFVLKVCEFWWLLCAEILMGIILFILSNKFKNVRKIKYTKRMIRLIVFSVILLIIECVLIISFLPINVSIILLPLSLECSYITISLSYILLMPVELLIGKYYITIAKRKLSSNKKLIKVGITGSFGKTSTKEILSSILKEEFNVLATPKSFNTPFGITKTINEKLDNLSEIFICEMGAKKRGEIKYLCELVSVDCGIVTSVGRQHTSTFGSIENVYKTKNELPNYLFNKMCVFNLMNHYTFQMYREYMGEKIGVFLIIKRAIRTTKILIKRSRKICKKNNKYIFKLYEYPKKFNYYAKNIKCTEYGSNFDVYYNDIFLMNVSTELIGIHNIINVLLAIALAFRLGMKRNNIASGVSKVKQINARLEKRVMPNGAIVLNNGYNSNIDSAKFTIETLKFFNREHKVIITPGLVETEDDYLYNEKFGEMLAKYCTDVVIVKEKNKGAILKGLLNAHFDMCNVVSVADFKDAIKIINNANENFVFLIENDLPDNYK